MGKNRLDERKLAALGSQIKKKFECVAHTISVVGRTVIVRGGNTGGFHLVMTINGWLSEMGFDVSYRGGIRGKYHALEVSHEAHAGIMGSRSRGDHQEEDV